MENISFEEFKKLEIRVGKITAAGPVEGSEKLVKLQVDFGEHGTRQILAGIAKYYSVEELVGKLCPFAFNLDPREMMGLESQGMVLAADGPEGPVVMHPGKDVPPGSLVK